MKSLTTYNTKGHNMKAFAGFMVVLSSLLAFSATGRSQIELSIVQTTEGLVVGDSTGLSLYTFDSDTESGVSTCYNTCAVIWPPQLTEQETLSAPFGVTLRTDGTKQVTLYGRPIYRFKSDKKAGDVLGEGVGGVWFLAKVLPTTEAETPPAAE